MKLSSTVQRQRGPVRGPQNLSRAKTAVHKMIMHMDNMSKNDGSCVNSRKSGFRGQQEMSRKEKRKQARQMRKAYAKVAVDNKIAHHLPLGSSPATLSVPGKNWKKNKRKKHNRLLKLRQEQEAARKQEELALANQEDERTIKKLEKEMHFRKNKTTKSKITPSIFKAEGLDYILDLVDSDNEEAPPDGGDGHQSDIDNESDSYSGTDSECDNPALVDDSIDPGVNNEQKSQQKRGHKESEYYEGTGIDDANIYEAAITNGEDYIEIDVDTKANTKLLNQKTGKFFKRNHSHNENISKDKVDNQDKTIKSSNKSSEVKMDPYGNIIGEGNLKKTASYIPPQKRAKMIEYDEKKQQELDRLRKQLKGLMNRLSESNIQSISGQIEDLYLTNSRNDMNELLTQLVLDSCTGLILTGDRLVMEHVMLLAVLNINIGNEVGAHFIETLASKLDELYKQGGNYGEGKQCDNIILLFTHLYNFKVIHCTLVYDIIRKLVGSFTERDIEMLLLILKNSGLMLRKDDPSVLKEIILQIQSKANTCSQEFQMQSRVKFMLETIYAIRNNNVRKISNCDPAQLDHMRKILRSLIKTKGHTDSDATLRISLEHLLSVEERGRWWIIGSSWAGSNPVKTQQKDPSGNLVISDKTTNMIVELSRQQRMNTDLRKAIFSVVMTAEDFLDAYEKILRLSLKAGQEREVVHVVINCCLQEATFNPYYSHLGTKLCQHDRKYKMAFQFAFWDKFKILSETSSSNASNLSLLLSQMFLSKALSISVLKVIEFADIDKVTVRFLQQTLRSLLLNPSIKAVKNVFSAVTSLPKLRSFREGLRLFLLHFVLPKSDNRHNVDVQVEMNLRERVQLANQTLAGEDTCIF